MRIILVEDDPQQASSIKSAIERQFSKATVDVIETESDFSDFLPHLARVPPALFIFDMMLPWAFPSPDAKPAPANAGPRNAGTRCAKAALGIPELARVPMIIHSVLSAAEVRTTIGEVPQNLAIMEKDSSLENLALMIRSLLRAASSTALGLASNDIFIVHGHDDEAKETVARFIEKLGGRAVVLHEQANSGRTIIEKFEHHANVAFAIVLLTPDDVGGKNPKSLKQRARQNVVFELGFFFAKLGRNKVCALHKEEVEIPSDIQGVIYTPMDKAGAWRIALMRELKAAGLPLNYDRAI